MILAYFAYFDRKVRYYYLSDIAKKIKYVKYNEKILK